MFATETIFSKKMTFWVKHNELIKTLDKCEKWKGMHLKIPQNSGDRTRAIPQVCCHIFCLLSRCPKTHYEVHLQDREKCRGWFLGVHFCIQMWYEIKIHTAGILKDWTITLLNFCLLSNFCWLWKIESCFQPKLFF